VSQRSFAIRYLDEAEDADQLKERNRELYGRVLAGGPSIFFPTLGIFLEIPYDRFEQLGSNPAEISDADFKALYHMAHETAHVAQFVVSGWLFVHAYNVTSVAAHTLQKDRQGQLTSDWIEQAKRVLGDEFRSLTDEAYGVSVQEILETHAVVQGLGWATAIRDPDRWMWLAQTFHGGARTYLGVLQAVAELFGNRLAFDLLPRLCVLALQADDPRLALAHLLERVSRSGDPHSVSRLSAAEFCDWAGADPEVLTQSVRERNPALFQSPDNPWLALIASHLDKFENLGGIQARLEAILNTDFGAVGARIFRPNFAVFGDGGVLALHEPNVNTTHYETWTRLSLSILDTLEYLRPYSEPG
jgi:hypothetical protein